VCARDFDRGLSEPGGDGVADRDLALAGHEHASGGAGEQHCARGAIAVGENDGSASGAELFFGHWVVAARVLVLIEPT